MSNSNNNESEKLQQQNAEQTAKQEQQSNETTAKKNIFQEIKMGDLLDFDSDNQLNEDKSEFKMKNILDQQKKERQELQQLQDKLMKETISLGLHKQKPLSKLLSTKSSNDATEQSAKPQQSDLLSKKLEKKWGLDKIDETEDEKAFMKDLLDSTTDIKPQQIQNKQNLPQSEQVAREKFISQHLYQPQKRKNITEYNARYNHEIDPMMQGSHLDIKNEDTPKLMRYMDEFREFKPQINIGERWGQIIQQSAISRIQYEQQISKGGNLLSYMAKTGKLGVDLYFIVFGITAVFVIPYMVFQHQKQKINYVQKTKKINPQTVPDFYYSEYDLDEISVQKSFYNQYTDEIMEEKNKKLKMHKEIQQLTNMLFQNK